MNENIHFTHDAAVVSVKEDVIVEQTDEQQTIDWDSLDTVRVDDPPYVEAFDTKQFYKLPITAARPVEQQYHYGGDGTTDGLLTLKKPRTELKRAAWSLDRRPVTLGHPDTKMVKSIEDIHGFHSDVEYYDSTDELDANAYIPVNDEEAQNHIEDNTDVSIGFHHRVTPPEEYDGIVGGNDDDSVDGFQTDLYINHSAFVGRGRCSSEQGCGFDLSQSEDQGEEDSDAESSSLDSAGMHGTVVDMDCNEEEEGMSTTGVSGSDEVTSTSRLSEDSQEEESSGETPMNQSTDELPAGIYEEGGDYYGIAPSENAEDVPKYELNNCSDVSDAWKLRAHGNYDVEQSTLASRIERMNEYHECGHDLGDEETDSMMGQIRAGQDYALVPEDCTDCPENNRTNETNLDMEFNIDFDDLSTEAALNKLGESHDGLAEVADEYGELEQVSETAQTAADELDVSVDELPDAISDLKEDAEKFSAMRDEEMRESAEELASIVDKYDDTDEVLDAYESDYDAIEDRLELLKSATETDEEDEETDTTETTVDSEPDDSGEQATSNRVVPDAWE